MKEPISEGRGSPIPRQFRILGIPVSAVDMSAVSNLISEWSRENRFRSVFVREVASLMAAVKEPRLAGLHDKADLVVPDGTPLVWLGLLKGYRGEVGRVPGADLVDEICTRSIALQQRHFFYGGKPGVADEMAARLKLKHPRLNIVGIYSPPMREIGPDFIFDRAARDELDAIKRCAPDFIWVGLSSPKQEYWMMQAGPHVGRGVFIGVGAAFDFHSGSIQRAPPFLRNNGLEWAHRLYSEPRRLWRRYLVLVPQFIFAVTKEECRRRLGLLES
jgi:N-acetylglucosaminyldiphosphoundecaprenol N-acetyl-beta-D-mannosaminyltransferase